MKTQDSKKNEEWDISKWHKVSGIFAVITTVLLTILFTATRYFELSENIQILTSIMVLVVVVPVHMILTKQLRGRDEDTKWNSYTLLSIAELGSVAVASQVTNALIRYIK